MAAAPAEAEGQTLRTAASRRNPWLDLLRSLAIILVLLRHGEKALLGSNPTDTGYIHDVLMNGWIGVDLFFVLSGYLIATQLLKRRLSSGGVTHYLAMRALRIWPAYLAVLFLVTAGAFPYYSFENNHLGIRVGYHLLLLQDYLPSNINVVFWSLGVEEKFYIIAPFAVAGFVALGNSRRVAAVILILFLVSPTLRFMQFDSRPDWTYDLFFQVMRSPFHMSLEPLVAGLAIAYAQHMKLLRWLPASPIMFLSILAGLFAFMASHQFMAVISISDAVLQPALIGLFCGGAVAAAVGLSEARLPLQGAAQIVAKLSYSLYLVHFPLIPAATRWADGNSVAFWGIYLLISTAVALLIYFVVERPFLRIKDQFTQTYRQHFTRRETRTAAD